ncbi:ubiquitin-protein ligase peroxin 12 [Dimargaris verticillata]|uniref:Peroxisome assembly protein 12 n=1 Tax=Dimargaris verticillata TaxID=2761393 RepID=A0A9W8B4S9_9FUNG|nr:ubiquitin-protein ligase peroxin 12 [Dimargaris verticillata]
MEFMSDILGTNEAAQPSLFELIAQDKLRDLLKPALSYALADEVFAALMVVVEKNYLEQFGSSFAENIYGLKRVRINPVGRSHQLIRLDIYKSLAFLVGLPYLKEKLDLWYSQRSGGAAASLLGDQWEPPELAALPPTVYYTPWLHLMRLRVQRMTMSDYMGQSIQQALPLSSHGPTTRLGRLYQLVARLASLGLGFLKVLLPMSVFFFRFLEWWYSSDFYKASQNIPIPPPPPSLAPHPNGIAVPKEPQLCPLCQQPRTNPAILPDSGYACCYPCLHQYVSDHQLCPITRVPATVDAIRKLYATPI